MKGEFGAEMITAFYEVTSSAVSAKHGADSGTWNLHTVPLDQALSAGNQAKLPYSALSGSIAGHRKV